MEGLQARVEDALDAARTWAEEVVDATGVGLRRLLVGLGVLGVVLGALWWLSRQAPIPVESTLPLVEVASATTTTAAPGPVIVHVAGAVAEPGVQRLSAGARVIDAIDAAGGFTADADVSRINLAAVAVDATQIYVPTIGEVVTAPLQAADDGASSAGPIDLNTADGALLESLPGVGPATAAAIIDHRERHGPFSTVDELLLVRGIGEAKLDAIRSLVRV